jgi:hypothetical protein
LGKAVTIQAELLRLACEEEGLRRFVGQMAKVASSVTHRCVNVFRVADQLVVAAEAEVTPI